MISFTRKRKTKDPCEKCSMHRSLCICAAIPNLDLSTRVALVVHAKELKRTTNTGRLALRSLKNSQMFIRGEGRKALDLTSALEGFENYLLYPSDDAVELSEVIRSQKSEKPIQLIVPDGNWRQASKVPNRHPELRAVPRVKVTPAKTDEVIHHLRKEHFAEGLSTLEAIASALGVIEGEEVGNQLHQLYQEKLRATLKGRGIEMETSAP